MPNYKALKLDVYCICPARVELMLITYIDCNIFYNIFSNLNWPLDSTTSKLRYDCMSEVGAALWHQLPKRFGVQVLKQYILG